MWPQDLEATQAEFENKADKVDKCVENAAAEYEQAQFTLTIVPLIAVNVVYELVQDNRH